MLVAAPPFPLLAKLAMAMAVIGWRQMAHNDDEQGRIAAVQAREADATNLVACVAPPPAGREAAVAH